MKNSIILLNARGEDKRVLVKIRGEFISNYLKENKISKNRFCKQCRISVETLNKILNRERNINVITAFKIARAMNIQIKDLSN